MSSLNWPLIRQTCGKLLLLESFFMALATLVSCYYRLTYAEQDTLSLALPTVLCALLGGLLMIGKKQISQLIGRLEIFTFILLFTRVFWQEK